MRFNRAFLLALLFVSLSPAFIAYHNPAAQATFVVFGARIKGRKLIVTATVLVKAPSS